MSDFVDEEYESFELPRRASSGRADDALYEDVDDFDDDDDDDFDDDYDDDLDDDDDDLDDDDDDLEDATDEDIDLVIAVHREDGQPVAQALNKDLANDLEELIIQLRRLPADAGATGFVSLAEEIFIVVRVRGQNVQVVLSDASAASDWPIARDVADFLGVDDWPDPEDDDSEPMGDLDMLADLGVSELDMQEFCDNYDDASYDLLADIADAMKVGPAFRRVMDTFDLDD